MRNEAQVNRGTQNYMFFRRRNNIETASPREKKLLQEVESRRRILDDIAIKESKKCIKRTDILNYCIRLRSLSRYLEIGVRNPRDCLDYIRCDTKHSVDPGVEFSQNPATFKVTSDEFFRNTGAGDKYDIIFIDGLHRADQVWRDINNSLNHLSSCGVIVLHDCNPPSAEFADEEFRQDWLTSGRWNGTTWKAMWKYFFEGEFQSCVVDCDWGCGIIDKSKRNIPRKMENPFFEFDEFSRTKHSSGFIVDWGVGKSWLSER